MAEINESEEDRLEESLLEESRLEESEMRESGPENELQDEASEDNDVVMLINDLPIENTPEAQELINNIKEYADLINQLVETEDILMDEGIIEMVNYEFRDDDETDDEKEELPPPPPITNTEAVDALEKVIRYQESLDVGKGFNESGLMMLQKKLKEWRYEKEQNKKQASILSFFNIID
ncbi:16602_t:CDS:1 [Dentiscutata erythropus]|uniref:16602_t:CDS:1 n=1 Tax=Dentiscutata erythropus TaxID=1348616 RepID=A0A9N9JR62_9GLOM|nr:16602_t:CDS:1 [Dentiscutata erythropus]